MFLRREEGAQLLLAHPVFGQGDVLSADEAAAGGLVDGPGEVGSSEDEDAARVAFLLVAFLASCGGFLQIRPLDEKLRFDAARGFVLGTAAAGAEEGVDFVDENDAGGEFFGDGEEGADQLFTFAQEFARQAAGGDGEENALALRRDGAGQHCFARSWWAEEEHTARGFAQAHEEVGTQEGVDDGLFEGAFGDLETRHVVPVHFIAFDHNLVEDLLRGCFVDAFGEVLHDFHDSLVPFLLFA